jgi:hypothetical protein
LTDDFRKNYKNGGQNRQAQFLARIAISCAFVLVFPQKRAIAFLARNKRYWIGWVDVCFIRFSLPDLSPVCK